MMVEKLDHIHIYVNDLVKSRDLFSRLLGTTFSPTIVEQTLGIHCTMSPLALELIQPMKPDSIVAKAMAKRGEGLYALSFKVSNLEEAVKEMEEMGMHVVGRVNNHDIREAQFHPKDTCGFMIELCEYKEYSGAALASLGVRPEQKGAA